MTESISFEGVSVGDAIPELTLPPINKVMLARYAGASGDFNPIHLDEDQAKAGGLPGIIAHGMLSMALLGRGITAWVPKRNIRKFSTRFVAMARLGDTITCKGTVRAKSEEGGEKLVELEMIAENQDGVKTLKGSATVALP